MRDITTELLESLVTEDGRAITTEEAEPVICHWGVDSMNSLCGTEIESAFASPSGGNAFRSAGRDDTFGGASRSNTFRRRREPTQ